MDHTACARGVARLQPSLVVNTNPSHEYRTPQVLAERLFTAALATAELFTVYLGIRLGLYEALALSGPVSAQMLAARAGIAPRYAREWLEQQAIAGILEVNDEARSPEERLYLLPEGHCEALLDAESAFCVAPLALLPIGGIVNVLPRLEAAYRSGEGVPFEAYGREFQLAQAQLNRTVYQNQLPRWIQKHLPDLHRTLSAGARMADLGCGLGWSSISMARAYSKLRVDGFDREATAIAAARASARDVAIDDRVTFHAGDARRLGVSTRYELVCIFDALHDMSEPVEALRHCLQLLAPGGVVLLMEPNAAEAFRASATDGERFLYAISLLHCLPVGLSEQPSAATGTVMRPHMVRHYAHEAGFASVTVYDVNHRFYRLYSLAPRR